MNKIFKVIYSKVRNCYVVTSEFAKANTKSSTGSAKQTAKKSLLSLAIAMGIACGGFVNVGAAETVKVLNIGTIEIADVYTKDGTESYVETKLSDYAKTGDVTTNKNNINDLKIKAESTSATLTDLSGRMAVAESDIGTLKTKDMELDQKIDKEIQDRENAIKDTNDRTGGITRNLEKTQTTIESAVKVDNQGNVKDVKNLSAETITTKGDAAIGGTLGVTGETTLGGTLTAEKDATFEKNVTVQKDLTVDGKLNVGEIYLEHKKLESTGKEYDSATSITADGISNRAKVTDENNNTTESKFTHNEKGMFNYAKDEKITGDKNTHTYSQTAAETKEQLVNGDKSNFEKKTAEGNTISIKDKDAAGNPKSLTNKQTVDGEKTSVTNNESSSTINQGADQIRHNVTSAGKESSIEVKADGITNTSKDGTITNDAKDIVNKATGNMTNTVGGDLTTTVTGQATENFNGGLDTNVTGTENHTVTGDQTTTITGNKNETVIENVTEDYKKNLTTTVGGNEIHDVKGTKTETVEGKLTENFKGGQETNVTGDQVNTIGGDQKTNVTGDISNTANNITNEATTKLTDKVGANTRVLDGEGITDTVGGSTLTSRVTQKKGSIEAVVTDGTSFNQSRDIPVASTKTLTGYGKMNQLLDDLNSSTKTITDGTNKTTKLQTARDITNTAENGTITNAAMDIVNNAQDTITNTAGTKITDTAGDSTVTTEKDKGTTFTKRDSMAYRDGGRTDTNISGNTINTGKVIMDYADVMRDLGVGGKTTTGSLEVKGESKLTGKVTMESDATVGGTLDVTGKATFHNDVDITGDVTANSYKVGRNTYISADGINANNQKITNVADGSISEGSKDAVNGGQLFETNRRIDQFDSRINEVGANAAAMANLHPMEFDADSKLNVAVGVGNYRNKTATAMGLFYRPNEDVMFNVSSTIGSSDNMIGGGVSFRLGSGGNKLKNKAFADAVEQNKQLKSQVDTLQAQMDALLSVINPNMSKDFPDVPDNHWAYEAVSRLAGNDIIQGYEDGKYHGERTMTRYEMAVIIYKALQKGTKAEAKLVEEFKPELKAIAAHEKA